MYLVFIKVMRPNNITGQTVYQTIVIFFWHSKEPLPIPCLLVSYRVTVLNCLKIAQLTCAKEVPAQMKTIRFNE